MKRSTINRLHRKQDARVEILNRQVFCKFYGLHNMTLDAAIKIIQPYGGTIAAQIGYLDCRDGYFGPDRRSGKNTYGYKSEESILNNLQYISDRFNAQFRLQWVLDLINKKYD